MALKVSVSSTHRVLDVCLANPSSSQRSLRNVTFVAIGSTASLTLNARRSVVFAAELRGRPSKEDRWCLGADVTLNYPNCRILNDVV